MQKVKLSNEQVKTLYKALNKLVKSSNSTELLDLYQRVKRLNIKATQDSQRLKGLFVRVPYTYIIKAHNNNELDYLKQLLANQDKA